MEHLNMINETKHSPKTSHTLRTEFWEAPIDALLDRKTIAAGLNRSMGWMELKATTGGGVPFYKCGRRCLYRKYDALQWLETHSKMVRSTSEYETRPPINTKESLNRSPS